jgi:hypothetical protein
MYPRLFWLRLEKPILFLAALEWPIDDLARK